MDALDIDNWKASKARYLKTYLITSPPLPHTGYSSPLVQPFSVHKAPSNKEENQWFIILFL